ncbi:MAG: hypothetical protein AABX11_04920 [Nanoarchaeota archaeon]
MKLWSDKIGYLRRMKEFYSKIEYNGINLWPVMATEIYPYYYFSHTDKIEEPSKFKRNLMKIKALFFKENFYPSGKKNKLLVSYFMARKDHYELVKKSVEAFPKGDLCWIDAYTAKEKNLFLRNSFRFPKISLLLYLWKKFEKSGLKEMLGEYYFFFIARTYYRCMQIEEFEKIIERYAPRGYLSFSSSSMGEETILASICNKKDIPTFTLQHGFLSNNNKNFSPFIIQNENLIAGYSLLWGKSSQDIQSKCIKDVRRLLVVGNPKYDLPKQNRKEKFKPREATFFFSVPAYRKSNEKLLILLREFSKKHHEIKFNLKLHPFDKIENYSEFLNIGSFNFVNKEDSIPDLLKRSDFVIVHNTSVAYESLLYEIPIFRFKDEFWSNLWDIKDYFSNLEEIERLFKKRGDLNSWNKILKKYINERGKMFFFPNGLSVSEFYKKVISAKLKI